ncbi:TonB-dependent receptor [Sphingobacterium thalpophilum]|uniref:TonB-dependent receptor n=1 Tax=Sphingobacterium thalpophilum TaxID=259 RepID=UPI002D77D767|nr:TonB-dependent receptor [Sphingobacterium thalpophilum]
MIPFIQYMIPITCVLFPCATFAQQFTISGTVHDAATGKPLSGATIRMEPDSTVTSTNAQGFYKLMLPAGTYRLSVSHPQYQRQQHSISVNQPLLRDYALQPLPQILEEVLVSRPRQGQALDDPQSGIVHLSIKEIRDVPALLGEQDVLKTIQLLPGVQSGGEGSAHFTVRGGDVGQNLVLLDQATIYNPSHLLGFFSSFNADAIRDIQLYKGGIPAQFGGRIASVLDISMLEGNKKHFTGEGGLGVIASRLKVEGPIAQDKSSFLFSARRSYADSFLKLVKDKAMADNKLYFYDLNSKLSFHLGKKTSLYLSGYHGRDELKYSDLFSLSWSNSTATARLSHRFTDKISSNSSLIYSRFNYNAGVSSEQTDFQVASTIENVEAKQDISYYVNEQHIVRAGASLLLQWIRPANLSSDINQSVNPTAMENQRGLDLGGYLLHEWKPTDRISLNYGIHMHDFMVLGPRTFYQFDQAGKPIAEKRDESRIAKHYINLEPRLAASLLLDERRSLKLSYNRLVQNLHQLSNTSSSLPTDQYVLSSLRIKPQMVDQASFGYFQKFLNSQYDLSIETYYKRLLNQIDVRNGATLQANSHFEGELLFGIGRAYGLEGYFRKHSGRLTGWLSYTLSKSQRKFAAINQGRWFNARQDRSHDLAVVANYALTPSWTIGATFVFNTGNAVTFPSGKYLVNGRSMFYYTERNGYRMPDYHRLDLGATYSPGKTNKGFRSSWTLGIYNLYNRKNAYTIDFRENKANPNLTEAYKIVLFGIVPSLTWNFKF